MIEQTEQNISTEESKERAFKVIMSSLCLGGVATIGIGTALSQAIFSLPESKYFLTGIAIGVSAGVALGSVAAGIMRYGFLAKENKHEIVQVEEDEISFTEVYDIHYAP